MRILLSESSAEILKKALATYGGRNQEDIAIEEMSELTKALIKNRRYNTEETRANIIEELADVLIMVSQLIILYDAPTDFLSAKIDRLKKRLDEEPKKEEKKVFLVKTTIIEGLENLPPEEMFKKFLEKVVEPDE